MKSIVFLQWNRCSHIKSIAIFKISAIVYLFLAIKIVSPNFIVFCSFYSLSRSFLFSCIDILYLYIFLFFFGAFLFVFSFMDTIHCRMVISVTFIILLVFGCISRDIFLLYKPKFCCSFCQLKFLFLRNTFFLF